jgi:hypothetical protein
MNSGANNNGTPRVSVCGRLHYGATGIVISPFSIQGLLNDIEQLRPGIGCSKQAYIWTGL